MADRRQESKSRGSGVRYIFHRNAPGDLLSLTSLHPLRAKASQRMIQLLLETSPLNIAALGSKPSTHESSRDISHLTSACLHVCLVFSLRHETLA
jgi:hypothetical protein